MPEKCLSKAEGASRRTRAHPPSPPGPLPPSPFPPLPPPPVCPLRGGSPARAGFLTCFSSSPRPVTASSASTRRSAGLIGCCQCPQIDSLVKPCARCARPRVWVGMCVCGREREREAKLTVSSSSSSSSSSSLLLFLLACFPSQGTGLDWTGCVSLHL